MIVVWLKYNIIELQYIKLTFFFFFFNFFVKLVLKKEWIFHFDWWNKDVDHVVQRWTNRRRGCGQNRADPSFLPVPHSSLPVRRLSRAEPISQVDKIQQDPVLATLPNAVCPTLGVFFFFHFEWRVRNLKLFVWNSEFERIWIRDYDRLFIRLIWSDKWLGNPILFG
jgi:hypothetical protein